MHILLPETDNCPSWISSRERMTVENISWSISTKECCRSQRGLKPRPPGPQSDGASNWATKATLLESEGREWPQNIFHDQTSTKECCRLGRDRTATCQTCIQLSHPGRLAERVAHLKSRFSILKQFLILLVLRKIWTSGYIYIYEGVRNELLIVL